MPAQPFLVLEQKEIGDHKYFPSLLAAFRCAVTLIGLTSTDFARYPNIIDRSFSLCNNRERPYDCCFIS